MAIVIEPLDCRRAEEARRVHATLFGEATPADQQDFVERLRTGGGLYFVAIDTDTDRVVGIKFGNVRGNVCVGSGIGVLPQYRRRGIATRLVRAFEQAMLARPEVKFYAFGSGTGEGIPFHIASGYVPKALIQFNDRNLRDRLDLSGQTIERDGFNETHNVYQIYLKLDQAERNLTGLKRLQAQFPQVNVQFMFSRELDR